MPDDDSMLGQNEVDRMSDASSPDDVRSAILGLAGSVIAASDQAQAMTDEQLGRLLLNGGYTTIEVYEAGLRLVSRKQEPGVQP